MPNDSTDAALDALWATYSTWSATARYYRSLIDRWSLWTLVLAVVGAIFATGSQQWGQAYPEQLSISKDIGIGGAICVALAAYFTAQMLGSDREKLWTKSRAAAESLKSLLYLYRASAAPFSGADRGTVLETRVNAVLAQTNGVVSRITVAKPNDHAGPLSVIGYLTERVDDQIAWYNKRAVEYQSLADRWRILLFILGAVSAIAAVFNISVWATVVATATTAITAYVKNRRYQGLISLYSNTETRLRFLKSNWAQSGKSEADKADRDALLQRCEETLSLENGSWVAQWSEQQPGQSKGISV